MVIGGFKDGTETVFGRRCSNGALSEQTTSLRRSSAISYPAIPNQLSFRYFKTSSEIIRVAPMLYEKFPLSLRNVEDLLDERVVDLSYEAILYWCHRFVSQFVSKIQLLNFTVKDRFWDHLVMLGSGSSFSAVN